jgi:hypothetical protein
VCGTLHFAIHPGVFRCKDITNDVEDVFEARTTGFYMSALKDYSAQAASFRMPCR